MTSFQISISPNRRAAARFTSHVRRTLQRIFVEEQERSGVTQSDVARKLNIHRSVVSRELHGRREISIGRIAEYAWALGREINFDLPLAEIMHGVNRPANVGGVKNKVFHSTGTSTSVSSAVNIQITAHPPTFISNSSQA